MILFIEQFLSFASLENPKALPSNTLHAMYNYLTHKYHMSIYSAQLLPFYRINSIVLPAYDIFNLVVNEIVSYLLNNFHPLTYLLTVCYGRQRSVFMKYSELEN
jgi:hypothetical protein